MMISHGTLRKQIIEKNEFIYDDSRIKLYEIDCLDTDVVTKRNVVFKNIKDGFFYLLDDDTIFLEETYQVYKKYSDVGFEGMIVGQNNLIKKASLSTNPEETFIDTGMVICHSKVLRKQVWEWSETVSRDWYFWSKCYVFFGRENTLFVDRVISHFNYLGPYLRIRKSFLFWSFKYDVFNLNFAKNYVRLVLVKNLFYYFIFFKRDQKRVNQIDFVKSLINAFSK